MSATPPLPDGDPGIRRRGPQAKMRMILACLIALLPFWPLRRLAYRHLLGYRIDAGSRIAPLTVLLADQVTMSGARIGPFNHLKVGTLEMAPGALIARFNRTSSVRRISLGRDAMVLYSNFIGGTWGGPLETGAEILELGARSQLTIQAFVDLNDRITLGADVVAGGARSQFWTHGFDCHRRRLRGPITIADTVFIGAASLVLPNVSICSGVTIGAGSVIHRSISEPGLFVSSQLIRKG